jgi:glycine cleavage system aminomethyltransferase T
LPTTANAVGSGSKAPSQFSESHVSKATAQDLKKVPLDALHRARGAKMVPFAGYAMPVHYEGGIIAEHLHTRATASLFDVSHMGQAHLRGDDAAAALETLVPGDIKGLTKGKTRYTLLTNDKGGVIDDLMVTNCGGYLFLVVNAACKERDFAHIRARIGARAELEVREGRALIALQGPAAATVFGRLVPAARHMSFLTAETLEVGDISCFVSRSGYTGEDGYEISVAAEDAEGLARMLLDEPERKRVGLKPDGKAPARAHTPIQDMDGNVIGEVTSGGYGPTVEGPIAMGYVKTAFAQPDTPVNLMVRGKPLAARVVKLPFVDQQYFNT